MSNENGEILSPDEVKQRRQRVKVTDTRIIEDSIDKKIESFPRCVQIDYESMGRFSTPATMYFADYSTDDITDIVMSSPENLIDTLVPILNKMKRGEVAENFDVASMTVEEFIETLLSLKMRFNTTKHIHPYMCDCQYRLPEDEQKLQEGEIDLTTLTYKSILDVEEEYRNTIKKELEDLPEEDWIEYRNNIAKVDNIEDPETITKGSAVAKITIKEPFTIYSGENKITLRLTRIADVIKAQKLLDKEFSSLIKRIQNRVEHGVSGEILKAKKQEELEEIQKQKTKKLISYIKAFSILTLNDKVLSDNEKIELMKNREIFPRQITQDIDNFLDQLKHGIYQEKEFTCPICGKLNKESLQHSISITELLPLNSKNERDNRQHTRLNIRFGA